MYSPNIILPIKSRRLRWADHVARTGRGYVNTEFWWWGLRERDHLKDPGIYGRIILRWILRKLDGGMGWIDLAQGRDKWRDLLNPVMNYGVT